MYKIIIGVVLVLIVVIAIFMKMDPNLSSSGSSKTTSGDYLTASIDGEITRSGTYVLAKNATLEDLITAGGGVTDNADELAYHASFTLVADITYYIAPLYASDDICATTPIAKVGINTGVKEDLMTVSGIGATLANAIIAYREDNGNFDYLEEIMEVSGIGNATYTKVRNYITLA